MADSKNTPSKDEGKTDDVRIEARRAVFELGINLEGVSVGLEAFSRSPAAAVADAISVLRKFLKDALQNVYEVVRLLNTSA